MSGYHRCPKCASDHMIDAAYVTGKEASGIVVGVDRHPDHGPLDRPVSTGIHACVCGSCGFVELYANKPVELYEAYRRAERRASATR